MLTPSSNTVLEPLTSAMVATLPGVTAHFSRFPVTEIALSAAALGQFDDAPVLAAAALLAHAKVDVIAWSGTAGTDIPATTSVLAMNAALAVSGARRLGLVTPYTADVQQRIMANYATLGFACVAERHFGLHNNFAFATVPADALTDAIRAVAAGIDPGCVTGWGRLFQYGAR